MIAYTLSECVKQGWGLAGQWWSTQHHIYDPPSHSSRTPKPICWTWFRVSTLTTRNMVSYNTFNLSVLDRTSTANIVNHMLWGQILIVFNNARHFPYSLIKTHNKCYLLGTTKPSYCKLLGVSTPASDNRFSYYTSNVCLG